MKYLMVLSVILVSTITTTAQDFRDKRVVVVEGVAEAIIEPDEAVVSLGVVTEGKDVHEVKAENIAGVQQLIGTLTRRGILMKDIKTSTLKLEPVYDYKENRNRKFVKYIMRNVITVKIRKLESLNDIISMSADNGSNVIESIRFVVSNREAILDSLRIEAAKSAKIKADHLAAAVGAKLGNPLNISENGNGVQFNGAEYGWSQGGIVNTRMKEDGPMVSAGSIQLKSTVNATFELE